jgi:hypothetical protein
MKRSHVSKGRSKRMFKRTVDRAHKKNFVQRPIMRGGYRL